MCRRLYLLAATFAGLALLALAVDLQVAAWFRQRGLPGEVRKLVSLAEVFAHGIGAAVLVGTVYVLDRANRRRVPRLVACAFGAGLLSNVVKILVGRYRPNAMEFQDVWQTFAGWIPWATQGWRQIANSSIQSCPSSHVATATGLAVGLSWLYPQGRWLFGCFAVLATLQRFQAAAHFPSDALAGAAVGCLLAGYCLAPHGLGRLFDRLESGSQEV